MRVLSCDPGLRGSGVGVFEDGKLVRAAYVKSPERIERGPPAWRAMAHAVSGWVGTDSIDTLVLEVPQVYRAGQQKGDPDDILQLAGVDGAVVGMIWSSSVKWYLPREWKGQVEKSIMVRRIEKLLTPEEVSVIEACPASLRHNIIDGIGLGLFYLKRMA